MIEVSGLTKTYGNKRGITDISFTINEGEIVGFLGPNGAGKSTTMNVITGYLSATAGAAKVAGIDILENPLEAKKHIGYLPQELAMYPSLSAFDFVNYMAELKGVHDRKAVNKALEQVEMLKFSKRKIGQLSGGMKRRVGIAQALVGDPKVLVVDEPTAGLDPEERVRFRGVLSRFAKDGRTVLLSTHIVEDVHQVCEELAVLRKGRLFYAGRASALMERIDGKVKIMRLESEEQLIQLQKQAIVISTTYESNGIVARIMDENMAFDRAERVQATLEDAYVSCMGGKSHE